MENQAALIPLKCPDCGALLTPLGEDDRPKEEGSAAWKKLMTLAIVDFITGAGPLFKEFTWTTQTT